MRSSRLSRKLYVWSTEFWIACCYHKHSKYNAKQRHTILSAVNFSGDGNKTKIAFHSRHLPKSVKVPSDTCNTRSAVCAIPRLWVIIMMVCSYFFDVSLSNAMTSLLFCESKFPVGSSARIREGRVINARPIATLCCWPPDNWLGKWLRRSFRLRTVSSSSRYFLSGFW